MLLHNIVLVTDSKYRALFIAFNAPSASHCVRLCQRKLFQGYIYLRTLLVPSDWNEERKMSKY